MKKRYQVFVSSTYEDLKAEREAVFQTLMKMQCMPAGMELFPASDEEQFEYIKRVIDDSDYYLLIIGGRYGSTTDEGISYTELEYDYARSKGLKVLAMLHGQPDQIIAAKTDQNSALAQRLNAFRNRAKDNRLVDFWIDQNDLKAKVVLGILNMQDRFPAVGWVRADRIGSEDLLLELNELRKENAALAGRVHEEKKSAAVLVPGIAGMDEQFAFDLYYNDWQNDPAKKRLTMKWREIFGLIAPRMITKNDEVAMHSWLATGVVGFFDLDASNPSIAENDFQKIKVQFLALGLIEVIEQGVTSIFFQLTKTGYAQMLTKCTVKSQVPK